MRGMADPVTGLEVTAGCLLLATPLIAEPVFGGSVVLVLDHGEHGALGVVLNRPSDTEVALAFPDWAPRVDHPGVLFGGGPVERDSVLAVGLLAGDVAPAGLLGWQPLTDRLGMVDLDTPPATVGPGVGALRLFAGYAGWSHDQLEDEVAHGAWYVLRSNPTDLVDRDPLTLWRRVVGRQTGRLAWLGTRPADPEAN